MKLRVPHITVILTLASFVLVAPVQADKTDNSCYMCHLGEADQRLRHPAEAMFSDIHSVSGLMCDDCHGGDPKAEGDLDASHSTRAGFVGKPTTQEVLGFCARCHSDAEFMKHYKPKLRIDQELEYRSSVHGKRLAEGDIKVATCISCHGVHGIKAVSDARSSVYPTNVPATCGACHANAQYMADYDIPTDQLELYMSSVHGHRLLEDGDISAPACNDCHGNHGAAPLGITDVSFACGECHANNRDYFNNSPHREAYEDLELGQCTSCHTHHAIDHPTDAMLGVGDDAFCVTCHDEGDAGYETASAMRLHLDSLKLLVAEARELLDKAELAGIDVKGGKYDLHTADDAIVKARSAIHHFNLEKFIEIIGPGMDATRVIHEIGAEAIRDLRVRQIGLGLSLPIIGFVALMLWLTIRRLDRRKRPAL